MSEVRTKRRVRHELRESGIIEQLDDRSVVVDDQVRLDLEYLLECVGRER